MRFRWDSSAARDIAAEMGRLGLETEDCVAEIDRGKELLRQMQGGDMSQAIEKYISAADALCKKLRIIAEAFGETRRGINRADELFDELEADLNSRARNMGEYGPVPLYAEADSWSDIAQDGVAPIFYNIPNASEANGAPWPTLEQVNETVVLDRVSLNAGMVTPQWLEGIIDNEQ